MSTLKLIKNLGMKLDGDGNKSSDEQGNADV